jgi:hypothetical protein
MTQFSLEVNFAQRRNGTHGTRPEAKVLKKPIGYQQRTTLAALKRLVVS